MTFRAAAAIRWDRLGFGAWGRCEECGVSLPEGTVPHHVKAAGLGGKRKHEPENLAFLCMECHHSKHF